MSGSPCQGPGSGLPPPISNVMPSTPRYALGLRDDSRGHKPAGVSVRPQRYLPRRHIHHLSPVVDRQTGSGQTAKVEGYANRVRDPVCCVWRRDGRSSHNQSVMTKATSLRETAGSRSERKPELLRPAVAFVVWQARCHTRLDHQRVGVPLSRADFAAMFRRDSALCGCLRFSLCPYVFVPACLSSSSRR
jgi:hypothetical protein